MSTLGERVRIARKAKGFSQGELASKVGMSQPTLSALERDVHEGSKKLLAIAIACGVNPIWLETGKGKMEGNLDLDQLVNRLEPEQRIRVMAYIEGILSR